MSERGFSPEGNVIVFQRSRSAPASYSNTLGVLVGLDSERAPLVAVDGCQDQPRRAATTIPVSPSMVGSKVVLLVAECGELIVTGLVQAAPGKVPQPLPEPVREIQTDGERLVFSADREIVLRCGKSSITLTREGKIVIRGADILETSSGRHRLQGASVEIN